MLVKYDNILQPTIRGGRLVSSQKIVSIFVQNGFNSKFTLKHGYLFVVFDEGNQCCPNGIWN